MKIFSTMDVIFGDVEMCSNNFGQFNQLRADYILDLNNSHHGFFGYGRSFYH